MYYLIWDKQMTNTEENVIEIKIDLRKLYDSYIQGARIIPDHSSYIQYEIGNWCSKQIARIVGDRTIQVPSGQKFKWQVTDVSNPKMVGKMILMSPMGNPNNTPFESKTDLGKIEGNIKNNEYQCNTVSQKIDSTWCTFAIMYKNNNQRWLYAWDPTIKVGGGSGNN